MITSDEFEKKLKWWWKIDEFIFYGKYEPHENGHAAHFTELRTVDGDLIHYPYLEDLELQGGEVRAFTYAKDFLEDGEYYLLSAQLNQREEFWKSAPLFVPDQRFQKAPKDLKKRLEFEQHIKELFWRKGATPDDAKDLAKSLQNFQIELYTRTERFIFELLQNADDYPNNAKELKVVFESLNENVLFSHNGKPFDYDDVESICSIGRSAKSKDVSATGYKGIGFKSVFTHSNRVYITSGDYKFCFDKHYGVYKDFDKMYVDEANKKFYANKKKEYEGPENIPWQLKPIWREHYRYPIEVREKEDWFNSKVGICLEFGEANVKEFEDKIYRLLQDSRFVLFLKNIQHLSVRTKKYGDYDLRIKKEEDLKIIESKSAQIKYLTFQTDLIDFENRKSDFDKIESIPQKLKEAAYITISFAGLEEESEIHPIEDSVVFTFLPTEDRRYNFPFLVNSDFVTSSNRERIQPENKWNIFVFEHVGYQLFKWLEKIARDYPNYRGTYLRLLPKRYNKEAEILEAFNKGYDKGAEEVAFLPTFDGKMVTANEAVFDKSGLFQKVEPSFIQMLDKFKGLKLIDPDIRDEESVLETIGVKTFSTTDIESLLRVETVRETLTGDTDKLCDLLKGLYSLENGKEIIKKLTEVPLIKKENGDYEKVKLFKKEVPKKYASLFTSLNILVPLPDNLENRLKNDEELNTIFVELLGLGSFDIKDTINKFNDDRIKTSFTEASTVFESEKEKHTAALLMWQFLFEQRNFEVNNQLQVDRRFKDAMIPDNQGNLVQLQKCKIEKDSVSKGNQSYLYQKFGDKEHHLLNLDEFKSNDQVDNEIVKSFFKQICRDIEITNYRLFKETFEALEEEDFKSILEAEPEEVIRAGLDYYQFTRKENNLLEDTLVANRFPVVASDDSIVRSKDVYLPKTYEKLVPEDDFYAEKLFEGVEGIYFLAEKYLSHLSKEDYTDFYNFLQKLDIKPGLKVYRSEEIKRNNRVDFEEVDDGFSLYDMRQINVTTNDNFSLIRHLSSLSGKIDNLVVFWEKLNFFWKEHRFIEDIRYNRSAPFIYLLSNHELIPTKGSPKSSKEIYAPSLSHIFPELDDFADLDFGKFPGLQEKIHFKERLSKTDLKKMLARSDELSLKNYEVLLKEHLLPQNFNQDEFKEIKNAAKFRTLSGDYQSIDKLIYVDKNIQETPLVSLSTTKSALAKVTIHHLNMGSQGMVLFKKLGVTIVGKENIVCKIVESGDQQLNKETFIEELEVFNHEKEKPITDILKDFNFIQCDKIDLSFDNFVKFTEDVYYYIDDKTIYYKSIRDLVTATSEKIEISQQIQRELENRLQERLKEEKNHLKESKESDKNYILDYERIIEGKIDLAQNIQNELHKEAIIKGTIFLDKKGYEITKDTYAFEDGNNAEILNILSGANKKKVMVRSAKAGLLFLHFKSWQSLVDEDRELLVMTGESIDDFIHVKTRKDLISLKYNKFNLIRKPNVNDVRTITDLIESDRSDEQGHLIFIANEKGYQSLFKSVFDTQEEYKDDGNISANPGVEL